MTEVQWRRVFFISSLVLSFMLIAGSIYLHIKKKHHLGRISYNEERSDVAYAGGVDAAIIPATLFTEIPHQNSFDYNYLHEKINNISYDDYDEDTEVSHKMENFMESILSRSDDYSESESNEKDLLLVSSSHHITEACMQCICETVTECKPAPCTTGGTSCGVFRISKNYWHDAGKPTVEGDNSVGDDMGYSHCVNNAYCASRAIAAFVNKYARDCNHDGTIDCRDHVALHLLGPSGCMGEDIMALFEMRMETCLSNFQ